MNLDRRVWAFISVAVTTFAVLIVLAALRQGWFAPHTSYNIEFESADGLHTGAAVTLMGLKVGQVEKVEISEHRKILVEIRVQNKYTEHLTSDAEFRTARPFVIGDKQVIIVPGSKDAAPLNDTELIQGVTSMEITDLLSGGTLGPYFETLDKLFQQLEMIVQGGDDSSVPLSQLYKDGHKALLAVQGLKYDVRKIRRETLVTKETKALIKQLARSTKNLERVMDSAEKALPQIGQLAQGANPMMPQFTRTLDELVLTLQAMQRSFFLRSAVAEIHEEREERSKEKRKPASEEKE